MNASIYEKLREQLDQYSVGFPATQSGIEIKILKRLFTEEEAGMYLDMSMMLETPEATAARTGRKAEAVSALLAAMARKGLLFRQRKNNEVKYTAVPKQLLRRGRPRLVYGLRNMPDALPDGGCRHQRRSGGRRRQGSVYRLWSL